MMDYTDLDSDDILKYESKAKRVFSSAGGRVWVDFEYVAQMIATIDANQQEILDLSRIVMDLNEMTWRLRTEMDNLKESS